MAAVVAVGVGAVAVPGVAGAGAASAATKVPPPAPTGVQVVDGVASATVSWTPDTVPPPQGISRYVATATAASARTRKCRSADGQASCVLPKLSVGVVYSVSVVAYDGSVAGPPSAPVAVELGLPGAPTDVVGTVAVGTSTVSFDAPASVAPVTSYTVTATDATDAARGGQLASGPTGPLTVTGLTIGDAYTFTVTATDVYGTGPSSAPSAPVVPVPVPGTPTGVAAVGGYGRATVSFTPPTGGAEGYTVEAVDQTSPLDGGESAVGGSSPIAVTGLTGGDRYVFTVTASNGPVSGAPSAPSAPVVPRTLVRVTGDGSSLAALALQQWVGEVDATENFEIDWDVSSSVGGLDDFAQGTVDYAASELSYGAGVANSTPDRPYQYLPDVGVGLGFMVNLTGTDGQRITDLNLTPSIIGRIFLGEITEWDDPAIVAVNPALATLLPPSRVIPVYRTDASGENEVLSDYLLHEDTADFVAAQTAFGSGTPGAAGASWPVPAAGVTVDPTTYPGWADGLPVGENGPDNVANFVGSPSSDGSIGYVPPAFAAEHGIPVANVVNASGAAVQPTALNVSTALEAASTNPDLTLDLAHVYTDGEPNAYPLSFASYLVVPCTPGRAAAQGRTCDGPDTPSPFPAGRGVRPRAVRRLPGLRRPAGDGPPRLRPTPPDAGA